MAMADGSKLGNSITSPYMIDANHTVWASTLR